MMGLEPLPTQTDDFATTGLTETEVRARRARGEGNEAALPTSRSYWQIVRANLFTGVNMILVGLGIALLALGRASDAFLTAGIVVVNAVLNTVQEVRAKRLLDRIALLVSPRAVALRDGQERELRPHEVVRGDLLIARPGDQIVADGRIIGHGRMEVDEALLTGEADPISKEAGDEVHSGSFCVSGSARYVAERVGAASFANQLTASARSFRQTRTPLQREIELLMRALLLIVAFIGLLYALVAQFRQLPLVEGMQIAAVVAGLIPNGLIFMVTIAYAIGALRLAEQDLLIQQTNAIESLSNVDVLCIDKTGTLTANRLAVHAVAPIALPEGEFTRLLGDYAASTSAHNPTGAAIAGAFAGRARAAREEIPFNAERKWSALVLDDGGYVLGAPDVLVPTDDLPVEPLRGWVRQGLRVLLLGRLPDGWSLRDAQGRPQLPTTVQPLGLVSLRDELRPEAAATLRDLAGAGVRVKVISGDHPETVAALATQAGLGEDLRAVTGGELAGLNEVQFAQQAEEGTIFGRITPQQKARLVEALRARGHYVAMIGDGVNDVLSLKQAHVGVAMQSGSAAARAVADLVLLNDSFAALPKAFREGQRILNGMRDSLALYLTRLTYAILTILSAGLVVGTFPFQPKQIALLSFLTLGAPTYAFVAWAQTGVQRRRGVIRTLLAYVLSSGLMLTTLALAVFAIFYVEATGWERGALLSNLHSPEATAVARSALTTALVLGGSVLVATLHLPLHRWPVPTTPLARWRPALLALAMVALYALILAFPATRTFFELVALSPVENAAIVGLVAVWTLGLWGLWRLRASEWVLGLTH